MQPAQNRFWRATFAIGMAVLVNRTNALAEPQVRIVPEVFQCGVVGRCQPGRPCDDQLGGVVAIGIPKDGNVTWNGHPIDQKTFSDYLASAARDPAPQMKFVIEAAFDTPYGRVAEVVLKMQSANVRRIMCSVPKRGD